MMDHVLMVQQIKKHNMTQKPIHNKKGFLLIEMLVAIFVFSIVMFMSIGAVLTLVDANKKNQSTKSIINNMTLVINGIAKSLVISDKFYCGDAPGSYPGNDPADFTGEFADCPNTETPSNSITFRSSEDRNNDG